MAKTTEELEQLLKIVQDEDLATLRTLDQRLHSLLEEKERSETIKQQVESRRKGLTNHELNVPIDPDLLTLVGIHPENPVQDDKALIRDNIVRRLTD